MGGGAVLSPGRRALRYRLPNPPASFVGREAELAWLTARADRPLTIVSGPDGVGKTALLTHHLTRAGKAQEAVSIVVRPDDPIESLLRHVIIALGELGGRTVDAVALAKDPAEAVEAALDLAESTGAHVLIDDVHLSANPVEVNEVLIQLASFARRSRWLVTARQLPAHPVFAGRGFVLGPMSEVELCAVGASLGPRPEPDIDRAAARLSSGSVWIFLQLRAGGVSQLGATREGLLGSLSEPARRLLRDLVSLRYSLERETLLDVTSASVEELEELELRGMVVASEGGFVAHDAVRGLVEESELAAESLVQRLASSRSPAAVMEALRLLIERNALESVRALLDERGEELLARGSAPRLWSAIGQTVAPALELWRMRCAAELGNATVLAAARPTRAPSALAWADMLRLMGDPKEALVVTERLDPSDERQELRARCALALGRPEEAIAELDAAARGGPLRSLAFAMAGRPDPGDQEPPRGERAILDAARAAWWRGHHERAAHLIETIERSARGATLSLVSAREACLARVRIDLERGHLEDAARGLGELRPYVRGPSVLRPEWSALDAEVRLARGPFRGLEQDLAEALEIAEEADATARAWLDVLSHRAAGLRGHSPPPIVSTRPAWRGRNAARLDAARRAVPDNVSAALEAYRGAAQDAAQAKLPLHECDAIAAELEARLTIGEGVEELAQQLAERAAQIGATRYQVLADYALGFQEPAQVERAAAQGDVAPRVARWARSRLGFASVLDAVDRLVLRVASAAWPGPVTTLHAPEAAGRWEPGWGIGEGHVWFADGRRVDFARRVLLHRVLTALFERGGSASKEELILDAWGDSAYHPGRHDSKLFVAVRAIRKLIERDPKSPSLLLTTEDGYALARPVRRLRP